MRWGGVWCCGEVVLEVWRVVVEGSGRGGAVGWGGGRAGWAVIGCMGWVLGLAMGGGWGGWEVGWGCVGWGWGGGLGWTG